MNWEQKFLIVRLKQNSLFSVHCKKNYVFAPFQYYVLFKLAGTNFSSDLMLPFYFEHFYFFIRYFCQSKYISKRCSLFSANCFEMSWAQICRIRFPSLFPGNLLVEQFGTSIFIQVYYTLLNALHTSHSLAIQHKPRAVQNINSYAHLNRSKTKMLP